MFLLYFYTIIKAPTRKITYLYNALGQKVEKKVTQFVTITTTDYQSGFQYENQVLKFFTTAEGYVNVTTSPKTGVRRFGYVYNYTDHLGNIRLSYTTGTGENPPVIMEENHYYPFGLKHKKYGSVDKDLVCVDEDCYEVGIDVVPPQSRKHYQYKYNHQEWQDELNLNVTAMDWRQYDNALGRFLNPDRLSELAPGITPYRFAFNNPNYWSDPTGLFESRNAALAHINTYGLHWATVEYNDGRGVWEITNGSYTFHQNGDDLVLYFEEPGGSGGSGGEFGGFDGINTITPVNINVTTIQGGALGGYQNGYAGGYDVWGYMSLSPGQGVLNYAGHLETLTAAGYVGLSYVKNIDPKVLTGFSNASRQLGRFGGASVFLNTYMDSEKVISGEIGAGRFGYRLTGTIATFATAGRIGGAPGTLAGAGVGLLFGLGEMAYDSAVYGLQQVEHGFYRFYNQATRGARRF